MNQLHHDQTNDFEALAPEITVLLNLHAHVVHYTHFSLTDHTMSVNMVKSPICTSLKGTLIPVFSSIMCCKLWWTGGDESSNFSLVTNSTLSTAPEPFISSGISSFKQLQSPMPGLLLWSLIGFSSEVVVPGCPGSISRCSSIIWVSKRPSTRLFMSLGWKFSINSTGTSINWRCGISSGIIMDVMNRPEALNLWLSTLSSTLPVWAMLLTLDMLLFRYWFSLRSSFTYKLKMWIKTWILLNK